jgi:hypothetical protein
MKLKIKWRHFWHEFYYLLSSKPGEEFAMKCKDVAEMIDLGQTPTAWLGMLRFRLHLSLCQGCRNYFRASAALKAAIRKMLDGGADADHMERLNSELLKKFSRSS